MNAMTYLAEIDNIFYGYETVELLRIDLLLAKKERRTIGTILKKTDDNLKLSYKRITEADLIE